MLFRPFTVSRTNGDGNGRCSASLNAHKNEQIIEMIQDRHFNQAENNTAAIECDYLSKS